MTFKQEVDRAYQRYQKECNLHQYKIIKTMDRNELIKLFKINYNDFVKDTRSKPVNFNDYLARMHPIAKKRLDLGI